MRTGNLSPVSSAWRQIAAMAKVGTIGFGGGSALIPLVNSELVERHKALSTHTFTQHTIVASITPGALPPKLGGLAGLHNFGAMMCLAMALAVSLPGTLMTLAMLSALNAGGQGVVRYVEFASVGITVFIIALLTHYISGVLSPRHTSAIPAIVIAALAFLATGMPATVTLIGHLTGLDLDGSTLPRLGTVQLIAIALVLIVLWSLIQRTGPENDGEPQVPSQRFLHPKSVRAMGLLAAVAVAAVGIAVAIVGPQTLTFFGLVTLSTLTSFGGGEAYVGVADGFFVAGGYVESSVFYAQLVPIANATPGPILIKLASGIGYVIGVEHGVAAAWTVALCAGVLAVATCTAVAVLVMSAYQRAQHSAIVANLGRYVLPVICGLLATTSVSMLNEVAEIANRADLPAPAIVWPLVPAIAGVIWLRHRKLLHDVFLLLICGGISLGVLLAVS